MYSSKSVNWSKILTSTEVKSTHFSWKMTNYGSEEKIANQNLTLMTKLKICHQSFAVLLGSFFSCSHDLVQASLAELLVSSAELSSVQWNNRMIRFRWLRRKEENNCLKCLFSFQSFLRWSSHHNSYMAPMIGCMVIISGWTSFYNVYALQ